MIKFLIFVASIVLMLSSFTGNVNAYKPRLAELLKKNGYSEKDMFFNHGEKKVQFIERVYPIASLDQIGQIAGLDTDENGDLVVFHRASRKWESDSFDWLNNFNRKKYGPIAEDILVLISGSTNAKKETWGAGRFYMPHGINIDHESNIWLTDVGTHQVFKFDFSQSEEPVLVLGEAFKHGDTNNRFCKPTGIEVAKSNGDVFVSDGYCNKRVVRFDKDGTFKQKYVDHDKPLVVAHAVALLEKLNLVCTVSREEGRIVCFDIDSGAKKAEITNENMNTVFSIEYDPINEVLHAATGQNNGAKALGLTFKADAKNFGKLLQIWNGEKYDIFDTHDMAISPDGSKVYLGQLNSEIDLFSYE
jgi:peptidylamidoglycolate lyase